jgi:type II restriction/modification system DNA methylase subunit YeeA
LIGINRDSHFSAIRRNQAVRMFNIYVEKLPIPKISPEQQQPFIEWVDKILAAKKQQDWQSLKDCQSYEAQIDQMVYALYGLTDDEIKIIEGGK